jgi:hypothetical protein
MSATPGTLVVKTGETTVGPGDKPAAAMHAKARETTALPKRRPLIFITTLLKTKSRRWLRRRVGPNVCLRA